MLGFGAPRFRGVLRFVTAAGLIASAGLRVLADMLLVVYRLVVITGANLGRVVGVVGGGVVGVALLAFAVSLRALAFVLLVLSRLIAVAIGLGRSPFGDGSGPGSFGVVVEVGIVMGEVGSEVGCGRVGARALSSELSSMLLLLLEKSTAAACSQVGTVLRAITLILCRASAEVFSTFF